MSYTFDSEDSDQTRQHKLQRLLADTQQSKSRNIFISMFTASLLLPIVPLAFIMWPPLWAKWSIPGVLGVVVAWGGGYVFLILLSKYLI